MVLYLIQTISEAHHGIYVGIDDGLIRVMLDFRDVLKQIVCAMNHLGNSQLLLRETHS